MLYNTINEHKNPSPHRDGLRPDRQNKSGVVVSTLRFGKLLKERGHHVIFIGAKSAKNIKVTASITKSKLIAFVPYPSLNPAAGI